MHPTVRSGPTITAKPFMKWAGGKTQLLNQYRAYYPRELAQGDIDRYVEPFLGSGALFLDIAQRYQISEALLLDINPELILVYTVVQKEPLYLIELLHEQRSAYHIRSEEERKAYFYEIRRVYNEQASQIDYAQFSDAWVVRAAYMIFLNKTCFNGLYRVNSKGKFNVPFGRYKRPAIVNDENIVRVSELLQTAELRIGSFQESTSFIDDRTFVYFDPPYRPISSTASFTSYSKAKFTDSDQKALAEFFSYLDRNTNAKLMLSNSDPTNIDPADRFFETLYGAFHIHKVRANRMINAHAHKRGKITELLITNY
jgi:DNA adenine methylase